jgi:hypothetical protein
VGVADECTGKFIAPQTPLRATDHNGKILDEVCFKGKGPRHVFLIGDWGGVTATGAPRPAWKGERQIVEPIDTSAQQRVSDQMRLRATNGTGNRPDYILNVGDCFYWGGIEAMCGAPPFQHVHTEQFSNVFELVYAGDGHDSVQWLGVLGNHDYGGYHFTAAWDQMIGYTWERPPPWTGRWMMPAQYWGAKVHYPDADPSFSIDYFFMDTNVFDAKDPDLDHAHNICSGKNNPAGASCGPQGPVSLADCHGWFERLWEEQAKWIDGLLASSNADWQVIVTHFPPTYGTDFWEDISERYGVDLITAGHHHNQNVHYQEELLGPTAWIVSGGGGGIVSESHPHEEGEDDQYGFVDLVFTKTELDIVAVSHGGKVRSTTKVLPRVPGQKKVLTKTTTPASRTAAGKGGDGKGSDSEAQPVDDADEVEATGATSQQERLI